MQKEKLIKMAEEWRYPKRNQEKIAKLSKAIIKEMCEVDELTLAIAKLTLEITEEILNTAVENEIFL